MQGHTIDFFLLLAMYFSFNRDFLNGLIWVLGVALFESAFGYTWPGVHMSLFLGVFLWIQLLKLQFVFHQRRTLFLSIFFLCLFEHVLHYLIGTRESFYWVWVEHGFSILFLSFLHACVGIALFKMFAGWDEKHLYLFEKQRTLFQGRIQSL